jgi:branched-chain amino acid transport system ATP-binding protein
MKTAMLRTEGLTKAFGANTAVSNVSIEVAEGELLCIIGPNGAGKTTFFNLLTKDLSPTAGRIFVEGREVTSLLPHQISRLGVGRSYQITSVFQELSVHENVWVAAYRKSKRGRLNFWNSARSFRELDSPVMGTLERVGLAARADLVAGALSYGDQRLLEIAITLASSPRLILLDEPTSGLSQDETEKVGRLIRELARTVTVVMIEHKMNVVMSISDRIVVMNFGAVIADGKPDQVAAHPEVRRAYFGT